MDPMIMFKIPIPQIYHFKIPTDPMIMFKIPTDPMIMFIIPTQTPVLKTNKVGIVNTSWSISQISALKETLEIWVKD